MEATEKLGMMAEMQSEHCNLSHGPGVDTSEISAVDWLLIPIGHLETKRVTGELAIPMCAECVDYLLDDNWVLLYCVECLESQWVYKPLAKLKYEKNIVLNVGCKNCSNRTKKVFSI